MQVCSGANWHTGTTDTRSYSVAFDSTDGVRLVQGWAQMSPTAQLKKLTQLADLAVISYMHTEGFMDDEIYKSRVSAIRNG